MSNRRTLSVVLMLSAALGLAAGCASSARARRPTSSRQIRGAEHVEFSSLDADLTKGAPTLIDGWLFRPAGDGPFPAKDLAADFRVAVAFYPGCKSILEHVDEWSPPVVPLHILTGESDDWTLAEPCVRLVEKARAAGSRAEITTYPGAFHDFDDPNMPLHTMHRIATTVSGTATLGANPEARADALARVARIFRLAFAE